MLGPITLLGEAAYKQEEKRIPLAGPDPLMVTCEVTAESWQAAPPGKGKGRLVRGR